MCVSCQTEIECPDDWASFVIHLPPLPPRLVLSLTSLVETIVRIYVRAAGTVEVRAAKWDREWAEAGDQGMVVSELGV